MKCEGFTTITDLIDYLSNNLIIAYYCGFDVSESLPSYTVFERFIKNFDNNILKNIMKKQVTFLAEKGIIDTSFIGLDSTPISANTTKNNPKSFLPNKFNPNIQPDADKDCKLGVHTASNQCNEKKYSYYWGYKNHILVDCITGLPIYELTTTANIADSTVAVNILDKTNEFLSIKECSFLADKGYDVNAIYDKIAEFDGSSFIPLNKRNSKSHKTLPVGNVICDAGLAMHKDGKFSDNGRTRQKYCCPLKNSKNGVCPCNHKNFNNGKKNKGCTKYQTLPDTIRLSINRDCSSFKKTYALRTECERYNSRFKATGQERMWVRNIKSVSNLNTISHICLLAVAIASIQNENSSYRKLKTLKRIS